METSVVPHRPVANIQFPQNRWHGHAFRILPADAVFASDFDDDFECFRYTDKPVFYLAGVLTEVVQTVVTNSSKEAI